jgi:hypothetical protein
VRSAPLVKERGRSVTPSQQPLAAEPQTQRRFLVDTDITDAMFAAMSSAEPNEDGSLTVKGTGTEAITAFLNARLEERAQVIEAAGEAATPLDTERLTIALWGMKWDPDAARFAQKIAAEYSRLASSSGDQP